MKSVKWTLAALTSFDVIVKYIALEQPRAARTFTHKVKQLNTKLSQFPSLGRKVEDSHSFTEYREVVLYPCRFIYKVEKNSIWILEVLRTERLFSLKSLLD